MLLSSQLPCPCTTSSSPLFLSSRTAVGSCSAGVQGLAPLAAGPCLSPLWTVAVQEEGGSAPAASGATYVLGGAAEAVGGVQNTAAGRLPQVRSEQSFCQGVVGGSAKDCERLPDS